MSISKQDYILHHEIIQEHPRKEWMLLIHGAGGSIVTWKRQIEPFKKDYNLIIVDLPGHGKMAHLPNDETAYTFEYMANEMIKVMDQVGVRKVHAIGVSLGTIIALQLKFLHPSRVLSVIMPGAIIKLNAKLRYLASASLFLAKIIGYRRFYKLSAYIMMPRKNHKLSRDIFVNESRVLTISEFKKWTNMYYNLNKKLKQLYEARSSIPQLVVMGQQDHLFLSPAMDYAKSQPNTLIEVIEKCGHVVSIEQATIFNKICLKFLSGLYHDR